jgi:septum formation protein
MKIILASTSPYRRQLMEQLNIPFTQKSPTVDEEELKKKSPVSIPDLPLYLARQKAESLLVGKSQKDITIGCDQMGLLRGMPLDKPGSKDKAIDQLKKMQGKTHQLITSLAIHCGGKWEFHTDVTQMRMKPLSEEQIKKYVDLDNPIKSAGSYKIESLGLALFEDIETKDYTAIIGLPMLALCRILSKFNYNII